MQTDSPSRRLVTEDVQPAKVFKRTSFGGAYDERARQEVAYNHAINPSRNSAHTDFKPAPDRSANSDYWAAASDAFFAQDNGAKQTSNGGENDDEQEPDEQQQQRGADSQVKLIARKPRVEAPNTKVGLHEAEVETGTGLTSLMQTVKQVVSDTISDFTNFDLLPQPTAVEKVWSAFTSNNRWRVWLGLAGLVFAVAFIVYSLAQR